jgi:UDP-N-acetylmuramyl pentapeptide phosphotransferase/UDP-N-acetylglucosamine-1-phosphate transferase
MEKNDLRFVYEYLRGEYQFQFDYLYRHRERTTFIGGYLFLIGSASSTLMLKYNLGESYGLDAIFLVLMLISVLVSLISVGMVTHDIASGHPYKYVPSALEVHNAMLGWVDYNKDLSPEDHESIEDNLARELSQVYAECAAENRMVNIGRGACITVASRLAVLAGILLLFCGACYLINAKKYPRPSSVNVVSGSEITIRK